MKLRVAAQIAAWLLIVAIILATLGPINLRPESGAPVEIERALTFLAVGAVFTAAYPRHIWWVLVLVVLGVIALEWLQNLRPDRHGREVDAIYKAGGAALGVGLGWVLNLKRRH
jgi:hypothetical protein